MPQPDNSYDDLNLPQDEGEQGGQPEVGGTFIDLEGRQVSLDEVREALRYKEKDYPNLQRAFTDSQRRAKELEDQLASLAYERPSQQPEVDYGRGYPPQQPPGYGYGQPSEQDEVIRLVAQQAERAALARLMPEIAPLKGLARELQELKEKEQFKLKAEDSFIRFRQSSPDITDEDARKVAEWLTDRLGKGDSWLEPELVYSHLKWQELRQAQLAEAAKKRKRASASQPGSGQPIGLERPKPKSSEDFDADLLDILGEGAEL